MVTSTFIKKSQAIDVQEDVGNMVHVFVMVVKLTPWEVLLGTQGPQGCPHMSHGPTRWNQSPNSRNSILDKYLHFLLFRG